jgi:PAS domain S-box-containing protein
LSDARSQAATPAVGELALDVAMAERLRESEARYRALVRATAHMVWTVDAEGLAVDMPEWRDYTGQTLEEHRGLGWFDAVHPDDRPKALAAWRLTVSQRGSYAQEFRLRNKDGVYRWFHTRCVPVLDRDGTLREWVGTCSDIEAPAQANAVLQAQGDQLKVANRKLEEQAHELRLSQAFQLRRSRQTLLRAEVSEALAEALTPRQMLQRCTEAIVRRLDGAFARIWTLDDAGLTLELQASAGLYTHIDGGHARVPVGRYKIGLIAQERQPHLTNDVQHDPRVSDLAWAVREGLTSFAGYPLLVEKKLVGVMAMFATAPLPDDTLDALSAIADAIAQGLERKRALVALGAANQEIGAAFEELQSQNEELEAFQDELSFGADQLQIRAAEVARQRNFIERLVFKLPAAVAYWDKDLIYRLVNPVYAKLLKGEPIDHYQNRHLFEVFPGAEDQLEANFRTVLATGEPWKQVAFAFHYEVNGEPVTTYWDFEVHAMRDGTGNIEGLLALAFEVTGRLRLEQEMAAQRALTEQLQTEQITQLQEVDRYKDEFLSVISHELRTPLNFITGFASTLDDEVQGPLNVGQHEAIGKILNGADRMLMLVDDLLDFAKIQSGRFELDPETLAYAPVVEEVLGLLKPLADRSQLTLETKLEVPGRWWLDGSRVSQVLTNLLSNAIKFTAPGGTIIIHAFVRDGHLITEVQDSGCGVAPVDQTKLFNRFAQLDMSLTRNANGTGLGLAISKALVEAHGGTIGVRSQLNEGATFWFSLPAR